MRIKIRGKVWEVVYPTNMANRGLCDAPETKGKKIRILAALRGEERLEVLIHEMLHAAAWHHLDETFVTDCAADVARALWKIGYRPTEEKHG